MSLVPLLFSNWWEDLDGPHSLFGQNFGLGLRPEQLLSPHIVEQYILPTQAKRLASPLQYYRPWGNLLRKNEGSGTSTVKADKDSFQVVLDVQQFKPEEISVKVVDKYVVVEGKHEEKQDEHGWISRQFSRRYIIPEQCDIEQVSSKLSSDGVLSICVPRKEKPAPTAERIINIEHTGKPSIRETSNESKKADEKPEEQQKQKQQQQLQVHVQQQQPQQQS